MSDSDDLEAIRERKAEELKRRAQGEDTGGTGGGAPDAPIQITGPDHLGEVVDEHDVVLVDFYADWCGPCQMLAPVVEQLAAETPAAVAKVDVDARQGLAGQYNVQGIPMLLLFADGSPAERLVGVRDKSHYEQLIEQYAG